MYETLIKTTAATHLRAQIKAKFHDPVTWLGQESPRIRRDGCPVGSAKARVEAMENNGMKCMHAWKEQTMREEEEEEKRERKKHNRQQHPGKKKKTHTDFTANYSQTLIFFFLQDDSIVQVSPRFLQSQSWL